MTNKKTSQKKLRVLKETLLLLADGAGISRTSLAGSCTPTTCTLNCNG